MTNNAPQVIIKICIETFATDQDLEHMADGVIHHELHEVLGLGYDAEGTPINEEIIGIDWERVTHK